METDAKSASRAHVSSSSLQVMFQRGLLNKLKAKFLCQLHSEVFLLTHICVQVGVIGSPSWSPSTVDNYQKYFDSSEGSLVTSEIQNTSIVYAE